MFLQQSFGGDNREQFYELDVQYRGKIICLTGKKVLPWGGIDSALFAEAG